MPELIKSILKYISSITGDIVSALLQCSEISVPNIPY